MTASKEAVLSEALQGLAAGILSGKRRALAKAITLIEDTRPQKRESANHLVSQLLVHTGNAIRIGISGVPGVGKSTFIEALGLELIKRGHRVAVLAVDPSSQISGGSILGDKVRMEKLARERSAFIRPSPSACSLGGVARRTRESMLLCEAAGYDTILIETVGVGQSEVTVSEMVDFFLVLLLPNAGDEIQGLKKGIIEMANALIVNKSSGEMKHAAIQTVRHYRNALNFSRPKIKGWQPPVLKTDALQQEGIAKVWDTILQYEAFAKEQGFFESQRKRQVQQWFHAALKEDLLDRLYQNPQVSKRISKLRVSMEQRQKSPYQCAEEIVKLFLEKEP